MTKKINYYWSKGFKYVKIPTYLISKSFHLFGRWWSINLFKTGYKRRRTGVKLLRPDLWKEYKRLIFTNEE